MLTQVLRAAGNLYAKQLLRGAGIAVAVAKAADAAHALGNVDELVVVSLLNQLLKSAVNKTNLGNRLYHVLVLDHQVKMHGLGQHGCWGPKGKMVRVAMLTSFLSSLMRNLRARS